MHIVLYNPEIPQNTGNIARLCAATQTQLHLIEPLNFILSDKYLKRAGLDYWPHVQLKVWKNLETYLENDGKGRRLVMTSAKRGQAVHIFPFTENDSIFFGPETKGLPTHVMDLTDYHVNIPIKKEVRSLNLATSAGIVLYQALAKAGELDNWEK